jgi:hypothetical protein
MFAIFCNLLHLLHSQVCGSADCNLRGDNRSSVALCHDPADCQSRLGVSGRLPCRTFWFVASHVVDSGCHGRSLKSPLPHTHTHTHTHTPFRQRIAWCWCLAQVTWQKTLSMVVHWLCADCVLKCADCVLTALAVLAVCWLCWRCAGRTCDGDTQVARPQQQQLRPPEHDLATTISIVALSAARGCCHLHQRQHGADWHGAD